MSSLVTQENFAFLKLMLASYIWRTDMESSDAKIGVFAYNSMIKANMLISLGDYGSHDGVLNHILSWKYEMSVVPVSMWQALNQIETMFQTNHSRSNIPDIAFLVVDTNTDWTGAENKAQQLRNLRIELFVIAVGFTNLSMPQSIAYNESEFYVQSVSSYAELASSDLPFTSFKANQCSKY